MITRRIGEKFIYNRILFISDKRLNICSSYEKKNCFFKNNCGGYSDATTIIGNCSTYGKDFGRVNFVRAL